MRGDDLEQNSAMDFDPFVGLHRPSPDSSHAGGSSPSQGAAAARPKPDSPLAFGEEQSDEERVWKEDLCHAISGNNWSDAKAIIDKNPTSLTAEITYRRRTALHAAAMLGYVTIVKELLKLLPPEFLPTRDSHDDTALALASWYSGNTQVARCLVNKNRDILVIPNMYGDPPVTLAFDNNHQELGRYLYSVTPLECLIGQPGSRLLHYCFRSQCFDIALHLLQRCEELLLVPAHDHEDGEMPIHYIATLNTSILSPTELVFWRQWIYNYINIPSTTAINDVCVDMQQEDRSQGDEAKLTEPGHGLLQKLITSSNDFVGVKKMKELKLMHAQADELLGLVCKNARKALQKGVINEALCRAAKEGNVDFVFQVSKVIPEIFLDRKMLELFNEALVYRQARVFTLIHGLRFKNTMVAYIAANRNNLMHEAATKAPDYILNRIYAPTLQMQRELQWFKEVESLTPPNLRRLRNKEGMTPEESFRENHRELMKEGEKWIKDTASSCSVVGTLIVTIMFAAAFTVPGGNDQNHGHPLFIKQPFFSVFIFSTILSLLSSSTSVLMFLAILTSHYSEEKFLKSLPIKLILGLSFLFISIVSMTIAFLSTIYLMLKDTHYSWGLLPIVMLACIPISLFVLSQFPLLLHTYVFTYGNLFDRNVPPWP